MFKPIRSPIILSLLRAASMTPHNLSTAMLTLGYFPVGLEICMISRGEKMSEGVGKAFASLL